MKQKNDEKQDKQKYLLNHQFKINKHFKSYCKTYKTKLNIKLLSLA